MSKTLISRMRLIGPLTVAAALGIGTLPALAQTATTTAPLASDCSAIRFDLANPAPGSMIEPGGLVLQGIASDSRAQGSIGVDRVDFFLDNRDQGGVSLGSAIPGTMAGPMGPNSFQATVSIPNVVGGHDLFAYARSTVTGAESVISVPVAVGEDPSKAGALGTTATDTCTPGSTMVVTTTPMSPAPAPVAPTTPATTTTTMVAPVSSAITLNVGNPSSGDTIHVGGYNIEGTAVDKAAQSGSGIDRVEIFLDNRDQGGTMLTTATPGVNNMWSVVVPLPSNQMGLHTLFFYAHSTVSGQEAVVSVPVTIAP